ncbi:MAG TPA: DUF6178 family protein [Terriglobia bacterium]|nr:DUF6178 family protein [Terriglobia bacterium]
MIDESQSPLAGSSLRIVSKVDLDDFLTREDAADVVRAASFEEIFFTVKQLGLGDSLDLLPFVTSRQIRGCIDLDCWRKDTFMPRPFMEWLAAFIQSGPEETVRALTSIDDAVVALFLKDLIEVYEVDRDDPPTGVRLIFTPDHRFGVEPMGEGEEAVIAMPVLDALFKYNPKLGSRVLSNVRYTTRMELEETAFDNKNRRLEAHGFVDYYEALSIYGGPEPGSAGLPAERGLDVEEIPGEETPGNLPAVFADTLSGADFLLDAIGRIDDPAESDRLAQELTALGNRILSANLVNLGEIEQIRPALEEMRDTLSIGMELMTGGHPERAPGVLRTSYIQTVFKVGFDRTARLRERAHALASLPQFLPAMLDSGDQGFLEGLRRFKPLFLESGRLRNFSSVAEIESAAARLAELEAMTRAMLGLFPILIDTFSRTFNTALLHLAIDGPFEPAPLDPRAVEVWMAAGMTLPTPEIPAAIAPFAERWVKEMRAELEPLRGKRLDPRFVGTVLLKL